MAIILHIINVEHVAGFKLASSSVATMHTLTGQAVAGAKRSCEHDQKVF